MIIFIYIKYIVRFGDFLERKNNILIIIIVILAVLIIVSGTFVYQNYKTQQMDVNMLNFHVVMLGVGSEYDQTNKIANTTPINYDQLYNNIDDMINKSNQAKSYGETAYQYADGPYKDAIAINLNLTNYYITGLELWKQRIQFIQQNNLAETANIKKQEDIVIGEMTKITNDFSTFEATNPNVKQHMQKYWNFTDS